jgi:hypothetical protein
VRLSIHITLITILTIFTNKICIAQTHVLTLANNPTTYKHGEVIHCTNQLTTASLKLISTSAPIDPTSIRWTTNGSNHSPGQLQSEIDLSKTGRHVVKVYRGKNLLIKVYVLIHQTPVVQFDRMPDYHGEYGFDDAREPTLQKAHCYSTTIVNTTQYHVPVLSLLPMQSVQLQLHIHARNKIAGSRNHSITLRSSTPQLLLNGLPEVVLHHHQSKTIKSVTVSALISCNHSVNTPAAIIATDESGNVVGKLEVICKPPLIQNLALVYVDRGRGLPPIDPFMLLDFLNNRSFNQLFVKFRLNHIDTIRVAGMFRLHKTRFSSDSILVSLPKLYMNTMKMRRLDSEKKYIFLTDLQISNRLRQALGGLTFFGDSFSVIFSGAFFQDVVHEVAHMFSLRHTFDPELNDLSIPPGQTRNFLDYTRTGRDSFFHYQARKIETQW